MRWIVREEIVLLRWTFRTVRISMVFSMMMKMWDATMINTTNSQIQCLDIHYPQRRDYLRSG